MWRFLLAVLLSAVVAIALVSCDNSTSSKNVVDPNYFPSKVGSQWVYNVYDSIADVGYETEVTITGLDTMSNGQVATLWSYKADKIVFRFDWVVKNKDSVKVYDSPVADDMLRLYLIPFEIGRKWTYGLHAPGSKTYQDKVELKSEFTVPAGEYDNVYLISTTITQAVPGYFGLRELRFLPHVGRLHIYETEGYDEADINKVWTLTEYSFPD
ncbi:MAG: hypothetical protein OEW00_00640 [candidate division Zixibacteria bacterium]|nr:hypothetical protein [candidate division Zixibacteria bacterium]